MLEVATPQDLPEIVELVNSAYRGDTSREGWTTEADYLDGQRTDRDQLADQLMTGKILYHRREGQIVACVYLENLAEDGSCYLGMLTVRPTLQAEGLGRQVLTSAENFAKQNGARQMRLTVIQIRDSLKAWYERRGYRRTGETQPFPYGNPRYGLPLRSDLYFVVFEKAL